MYPQPSGIAFVSSKTFPLHANIDLFHNLPAADEAVAHQYIAANGGRPNALKRLTPAVPLSAYKSFVFVIGNSKSDLFALRAAIQLRGTSVPKSIYLHDANIGNVLEFRVGPDRIKALYARAYQGTPPGQKFGIRALHALTGISRFIVNAESCAAAIRAEMQGIRGITIERTFHPIDTRRVVPIRPNDGVLRVGHFGYPRPNKRLDKILDAVKLIHTRKPARLVLAGFKTGEYLEKSVSASDRDRFEIHDGPEEERLLGLMAGIDVAVQLREPHVGETSGPVSQLIGQGIRPIVSPGLTDDNLRSLVTEIPVVPAEKLAEFILRAEHRKPAPSRLNDFSFTKAANHMYVLSVSN